MGENKIAVNLCLPFGGAQAKFADKFLQAVI
jgi:hypothetical protein